MVFPVLCFLALAVFLGCLGLFALAVTKVVAPDGRGHARGFAGGCAAVLALMLLLGLGFVGLGATVAAVGVTAAVDWNPIRRIEIHRSHPDAPARLGDERPGKKAKEESAVSARFTVRGEGGGELVELMHGLVDVDLDELADDLSVQHVTASDGTEFSVYEFRLPISEKDLERFERDIERELDGLELTLPESVDIQFEGAQPE